jgi:hypothetical protein
VQLVEARWCLQVTQMDKTHTVEQVREMLRRKLVAAMKVRPDFRGVLLAPARPTDPLLAQQDIHTTTLTVFPNNSIPLTLPESWRGKGHTSRNYQHLTKRLALLLITSPQCEELPPMNHGRSSNANSQPSIPPWPRTSSTHHGDLPCGT